jgi:redox-sensitive bicupin YhaK (pirin superfamily)
MIERKAFEELAGEDIGWLNVRRHFRSAAKDDSSGAAWGCVHVWNDEEIAPSAGFAMQLHADIEITAYVREGIVTHRDSLGNEGRIEAGSVQVVSAGTGIRHAEYNLEHVPARIFQIWVTPTSRGGSPAWGIQPCPNAEHPGCFVAIASGFNNGHDALPIRACARVLNAKLKSGESCRIRARRTATCLSSAFVRCRRCQRGKNLCPRRRCHPSRRHCHHRGDRRYGRFHDRCLLEHLSLQ